MQLVTLFFIDAPTIPDTYISLSLNINETWILLRSTRFRSFSMAFTSPEHCVSPDKRKGKTNVTNSATFCNLRISGTCYQMLFCRVLYNLLTQSEFFNLPANRCTQFGIVSLWTSVSYWNPFKGRETSRGVGRRTGSLWKLLFLSYALNLLPDLWCN